MKVPKAQIIVLMAVDMERKEAISAGYATLKEVKSAPVNKEREYPCHEIKVTDLHPIWQLFQENFAYETRKPYKKPVNEMAAA